MKTLVFTVVGGLTAALGIGLAGCGLVDTSTCEAGPNGVAGQPYTFVALAFPEKRCEPVQFPLGKDQVGGVAGRIVDSAGTPVEGAKVFAGGSSTVTGPVAVSDPLASSPDLSTADRAKHRKTLDPGEFVLLNLPVQTTVVTVQYDDQSFPFPVSLKATNSFNITAKVKEGEKYGLPDKGDLALDLKLPDDGSYGLRILRFEPTELTATATASKATFSGGSIVTFDLRNGPHASQAEITKVKVEYQDEKGDIFKTIPNKPISATIVPAGLPYTSGAIAKVAIDLGDSTLGAQTGNATAKVTFTIKDLKTGTESSLGDNKQALTRSVPISITRQ